MIKEEMTLTFFLIPSHLHSPVLPLQLAPIIATTPNSTMSLTTPLASPFLTSFNHPPPPENSPEHSAATCPPVNAILSHIRAYHEGDNYIDEEQDDKAEAEAIVQSIEAGEAHQDMVEHQHETRYKDLKKRREVLEKAIGILRTSIVTIDQEIEQSVRDQERARAQTQLHRIQKSLELEDHRRDMVEKFLARQISRRTRLIRDIVGTCTYQALLFNHDIGPDRGRCSCCPRLNDGTSGSSHIVMVATSVRDASWLE